MNITYNSNSLTSLGPNPYLLLDDNMIFYNKKWINQKELTLEGTLTGNFSELKNKQVSLINIFSSDFKDLDVDTLQFKYCKVNNISFPASNYENILNYSVSLTSYGDDFNSVNSGILDPTNEISINELDDGVFSVSHSISARGINKTTSALNAAKSFVLALTGIDQYSIGSLKQFNTNLNSNSHVLKSFNENIDRINGSYSVQEEYIFNSTLNTDISLAAGVVKYSVDYKSGALDNYATASVKGAVEYDKSVYPDNSILDELGGLLNGTLRTRAETILGSASQIPDSFTYNIEKGKVDFEATFANNTTSLPYYDYKLSYKYDKIYSKTIVEISGPVVVKGNIKQRNTQLDSFLAGIANMETYLYNLANAGYSTWCSTVVGSTYTLRPKPTNLSIKRSLPKGTLELSATFDDGIPALGGFSSNSFSISYNPPIDIIYPKPTCTQNGCYMFLEPDIKTLPQLSIRADGYITKGQESSAQANITNLKTTIKNVCDSALFVSNIAESENISLNNNASTLQASIDSVHTSKRTNTIHNPVAKQVSQISP